MKNLHQSADYFEPLLRARIVRALQAWRKSIRTKDIAMAIAHKHTSVTLPKLDLSQALKVVRDARRQGGKIGAAKVNAL